MRIMCQKYIDIDLINHISPDNVLIFLNIHYPHTADIQDSADFRVH